MVFNLNTIESKMNRKFLEAKKIIFDKILFNIYLKMGSILLILSIQILYSAKLSIIIPELI